MAEWQPNACCLQQHLAIAPSHCVAHNVSKKVMPSTVGSWGPTTGWKYDQLRAFPVYICGFQLAVGLAVLFVPGPAGIGRPALQVSTCSTALHLLLGELLIQMCVLSCACRCPLAPKFGENFKKMVAMQDKYDPERVYEPELWARLVKGEGYQLKPKCQLDRSCYCEANEHCADGFKCVPSEAFPEYKACRPIVMN